MNNRQNDFVQLVNRAVNDSRFRHMRSAIEKEMLIYNILFCLEQHHELDDIVFQGGTLIRLGHGGERLSEGLDFVAGVEFNPSDFSSAKFKIEKFFIDRYGLIVEVKEPKTETRNIENPAITVNRWRINANLYPERKDLPKLRVKIQIANVPAHTKEVVSLHSHYDVLPDGYDGILIVSETLDEVMADKLISLPAYTRYIRYSDIWDLYWLIQRRAEVNTNLVEQKVIDYHLPEYAVSLNNLLKRLPDVVKGSEFHLEMHKLLPTDVFNRTLRKDKFCQHLLSSVRELFEQFRHSFN